MGEKLSAALKNDNELIKECQDIASGMHYHNYLASDAVVDLDILCKTNLLQPFRLSSFVLLSFCLRFEAAVYQP